MVDLDFDILKQGTQTHDWLDIDILNTNGDIRQNLVTSVIIQLFTDRLCEEDELREQDKQDRRGWWADYESDIIWFQPFIGSKLWLLENEICTDGVASRANEYVLEALQPLKDIGACTHVESNLVRTHANVISGNIIIFYKGQYQTQEQFQLHWDDLIKLGYAYGVAN